MRADELRAAGIRADERFNALAPEEESSYISSEQVALVFAGTDLPAAVLFELIQDISAATAQAILQAPEDIELELRGLVLHTFLFGYFAREQQVAAASEG